jgi:copper transport protein
VDGVAPAGIEPGVARAVTALLRRLVVALAVTAIALVALAGTASAHAVLESTSPAAGAVLDQPPKQVTLVFGEPVEVSLGSIRLFDGGGKEISISPPSHPGGTGSLVTSDLPTLANGAYVVAWRVVSADSHPVDGAFTFQVGTGAAASDPSVVARILAGEGGDTTVGVVLGVARFAAYGALAVLVGGLVFVAAVWPGGERSRRARRILWVALGAAIVATAAGIALQAPYAEGSAITRALEPSGWRAVVNTRSGRAWEARLLVFAVVGTGLLLTVRRAQTATWRLVAVVAGAALLVAYAESGHGGLGRAAPVGLLATLVHLGAISVWIGGLVLLGLAVLPVGPAVDAVAITRRFSPVAFWSVVAVVASGLVQTWRQVGTLDALTSTPFGRVLVVKTAVVLVLIAVAARSRILLQARLFARPARTARAGEVGAAVATDEPDQRATADAVVVRHRLLRTIALEIALAAEVLAVTSVLVATAPAVTAARGPFNATIVNDARIANVTIIPAAAGPNTLHIYITTPGGALDKASPITVTITNTDRKVGPIDIPVDDAGPNHVTTDTMQIPFPGRWQIDIAALFGNFDKTDFVTTFTAR